MEHQTQILDNHQNLPKLIDTIYSLTNFQGIIQDIEHRKQNFETFFKIVEKRIKIEHWYAEKLQQLGSIEIRKTNIQNSNKTSQLLLETLKQSIYEEVSNISKWSQSIQGEIYQTMKEFMRLNDNEIKRLIDIGKSLEKQFQNSQIIFHKVYDNFVKKCKELMSAKTQYIVAITNPQISFEKKNQLFLKLEYADKKFHSINQQYENHCQKTNDFVSKYSIKMNQVVQKLELIEKQRLNLMRVSIMHMQNQKQTYGTNLVKETNKYTSYIQLLIKQNQQIKSLSKQQKEKQAISLKKIYKNPSQFINQLYHNISNRSLQEIILYGSPQQKTLVDKYLEKKVDKINLQQQNYELAKTIEIFKQVFEEDSQNNQNNLIDFQQLITNKPICRRNFILSLQKYRLIGRFQIPICKIQIINKIFNIFLDICMKQFDTYNSKQLMVLSLSYYVCQDNHNQKIYLQEFIKDHIIWRTIQWWQCALLESIYEETVIKSKKPQNNISIWDIKGVGARPQEPEQQLTFTNVVFNQIAYYVHNMGLFSISPSLILKFTNKYIRLFGISQTMKNDILKIIQGLSQSTILREGEEESPVKFIKKLFSISQDLPVCSGKKSSNSSYSSQANSIVKKISLE